MTATAPRTFSAAIQNSFRDGGTWHVYLLVTLPAGVYSFDDFSPIASAVRSATQSQHSDWRRDTPELWITVASPDPETDARRHIVFQAVCEGTNRIVIPRASITWSKVR